MYLVRKVLSFCVATVFVGTISFTYDACSTSPGPVIMTNVGSFQGLQVTPPGMKRNQYSFAFLGIPYAKPPTGELRFSKPVPYGFFSGVYNATTKPPSCFQLQSDLRFPWEDSNSLMSEDCLYLNIWTPETMGRGENLKPVMVWVHGGGFSVGSSAMDLYDGQILAILGQVLVVTLNYRLGPFGFLDTLTDDIPGNVGLHDQLLALNWIQDNIEFFGGDPKRVTFFGESAGAVSAGFLALSPLSRGLFQRLIIQSGSAYVPPGQSPKFGVENGNLLATLVGCANETLTLFTNPKEVVTCLKNVPPAKLTKTYYRQSEGQLQIIPIYYSPQFWDEVIPRHPIDIFQSKNYTTYDMLIGVTAMEGSFLLPYYFPEIYQQYIEGSLVINKSLASAIMNSLLTAQGFTHPQRAVDYYFKDIADDEKSVLQALYHGIGDSIMTCPAVYFAERYSEKGTPVFFYRFDHRPSTSPWPESMGVVHFEEIQFVFGLPVRYPERYQEKEKTLGEYMIRTWTNFAKSENLTLKSGSLWPNYFRSKPDFAIFQTGQQTTGTGIRKEACEFWRSYYEAQ